MIKISVIFYFTLMINSAYAHCFKLAGEKFGIDWRVIYAIAKVESSLNELAININKNNTVDIGLMQINTVNLDQLTQLGFSVDELMNPCGNVMAGTWLLKKSIVKSGGELWKGVGYYHSSTPHLYYRYIDKVHQAFINTNNL